MHETAVRDRIRQMLASGHLPRHAANKIDAAYGDDAACDICSEKMSPSTVTYELHFGGTHGPARSIVMHFKCYEIWENERAEAGR